MLIFSCRSFQRCSGTVRVIYIILIQVFVFVITSLYQTVRYNTASKCGAEDGGRTLFQTLGEVGRGNRIFGSFRSNHCEFRLRRGTTKGLKSSGPRVLWIRS